MLLFDWIRLENRRGLVDAFLFYLTSFISFLALTIIVSLLNSALSFNFRENQLAGFVAANSSLFLALFILRAKNISPKSFWGLLTIMFAIIAYYRGALLGLIPAAYFSTLKPRRNS